MPADAQHSVKIISSEEFEERQRVLARQLAELGKWEPGSIPPRPFRNI